MPVFTVHIYKRYQQKMGKHSLIHHARVILLTKKEWSIKKHNTCKSIDTPRTASTFESKSSLPNISLKYTNKNMVKVCLRKENCDFLYSV